MVEKFGGGGRICDFKDTHGEEEEGAVCKHSLFLESNVPYLPIQGIAI